MSMVWSNLSLDSIDDVTIDQLSDDPDVYELMLLDVPDNEVARLMLLTSITDEGLLQIFEERSPYLMITTALDHYFILMEDDQCN